MKDTPWLREWEEAGVPLQIFLLSKAQLPHRPGSSQQAQQSSLKSHLHQGPKGRNSLFNQLPFLPNH